VPHVLSILLYTWFISKQSCDEKGNNTCTVVWPLVIIPEFFDTSSPPYAHALHIWKDQDLYFHKKWVICTVFTDKIGFLTGFVNQIYKKINLDHTCFSRFSSITHNLSTPSYTHMPYIFGFLRTCTFTKNRLFVRFWRKTLGLDRFCGPKQKKSIWTTFSTVFRVFRKFSAQNQPKIQNKLL
jgi:hypothetical protein